MEEDIKKEVHTWIKDVVEPCFHSFFASDGSSVDVHVEEDGNIFDINLLYVP